MRQVCNIRVALLGLLALALLSACSSASAGAAGNPTTLLVLLHNSVSALLQTHSVHIDLQSHGTIQTSGFTLPGGAQSSTYALLGNSDVAVTTRAEQGHVTLTLTPADGGKNATTVKASEVIAENRLFVRSGTAQTWQVVDLSALRSQVPAALSLPGQLALQRQASQHLTIADHGVIAAGKVRHLTVTLDQQSAQALTAVLPTSMLKQEIGRLRLLSPLSVDFFLDEATGLPQSITIAGKGGVNVSQALAGSHATAAQQKATGTARMATLAFTTTLTFSNYNQPVQIHVPVVAATSQNHAGGQG